VSESPDYLELFYAAAQSLGQWAEPGLAWDRPAGPGAELRPGDDYNARASWEEILEPAGWTAVVRRGDVVFWRRPGKTGRTWSATTGHCRSATGDPLLHVFSANATPFEPEKSYSRFAAYTLLCHSGDYKAAARALAGKGYGDQRRRPSANGTASGTSGPAADRREPPAWEPILPLAELPACLPFPTDVLPLVLRRFLQEVADSKHAPIDYAAVALLVAAGGAIGASRALTIKSGWSERPCLYAAVVAPPGSAKTPALRDVCSPIYAEQARLRAHYKDTKDTPGARLRTIYVSDITTEALASVLQENERGVTMVRDELTAWAASMDQYKAQGRGSDRQVYLHAWSGEPISVHRKLQQNGPIFVAHPFVAIAGGMTPAGLSQLCGDGRPDDGFLDRILFAYPSPTAAVGEDWLSLSEELADGWARTLGRLWALESEQDAHGNPRPHFVRLTASGRDSWVRFTRELAAQMNHEDFPECLAGPWAKMRGYCARLALIIQCLRVACDQAGGEEVDGESIDRGARLVAYFQSHARKTYAVFDLDPEAKQASRVLRWIVRGQRKEFKARDATRGLAGGVLRDTDDLERVLRRLVKHGFLREKQPEGSGKGRPPGAAYEVNPEVYPLPTIPTIPTKVEDRQPGEEG